MAFQRKRPTLGEIYRIAASGGNKQKEYFARGHEVDNRAAKLIFTRLASTNNDTLTSYVSLLMTSGLDQWQNPAIDEATAVSDFDFRTIRKKPFSVYLVVQPLMVKPLAPLIRLFFSDLLSAMQEKDPGPDEPWPVMIMLDEFNRLGKMPIVVESIETLRTYRGHLAVVTQTIPALDEIYGENTRRALQGNAGVKLYLTPSDEKTVEELSKAVGKTTKTVVTRSQSIGKNPFEGRSQSTRTEESSLLPEDEARRLPLDEIVMVIDAQMPVRAKRIQYFDDRLFKAIHAAQTGELPFPKPGGGGSQGTLPLSVRAMPMTPPSNGSSGPEADVESAHARLLMVNRQGKPTSPQRRPRLSFKPLSPRNSARWRWILGARSRMPRQRASLMRRRCAPPSMAWTTWKRCCRRGMAKSWLLDRVVGIACLSGRADSGHSLRLRTGLIGPEEQDNRLVLKCGISL